jgi:hypothetical protein
MTQNNNNTSNESIGVLQQPAPLEVQSLIELQRDK